MRVQKSVWLALVIVLAFAGLTYLNVFVGYINPSDGRTSIKPPLPDGLYKATVVGYKNGKFTIEANVQGEGLVTINMNDFTLDEVMDNIFTGKAGKKALMVISDREIYNWTWVDRFH